MTNIETAETMPGLLNFLAGGGELGELIREHNWAGTPLGPAEHWPQSLKTAVRIMLTSRQPIWIGWGTDLIYLYNDAYKSIIGGKHPWALGRPTREVWREIWNDIGPLLDTAMGGVEGTYVEEQLLIMERNGYPEETYYTFSYSPIPDDDGTPGGIICANTDDTERVINERRLGTLRELAAETMDVRTWREVGERSAPVLGRDAHDLTFALLYIWDSEKNLLSLAGASGLPPGHEAAPLDLLPHSKNPWPVKAVMQDQQMRIVDGLPTKFIEALPGGAWEKPSNAAAVLSVPAKQETGRAGILIVGLNPYRLFDEAYRGFLGLVAGQISGAIASAEAYEEERRRSEVLAELDRAKTAFFSNVSHEFRTPLTLMLGPLEEVLAGRSLPRAARLQVEVAHRNGARLLRLVNSLLDFSRIEAGRVRAAYEPTDLATFSSEIASSFRTTIEKAGVRLIVACQPLPEPIYVDRDMWEKVLLNLLSNAFKFTFDGEIALTAEASEDGRMALVKIRDTGVGIPAEELPKLFERFHRIEGQRGRSFEGSGIGLALVHELIRQHGGEITADSTLSVGTTFTITLPIGYAHLPADQVRDATRSDTAGGVRAHEYVEEALRWIPDLDVAETDVLPASPLEALVPADMPDFEGRRRVVLADDNADMRDYVRRLLAGRWDVETVADGEEALKAIRAKLPDLVITDVMMPRLDGFGLLQAIRKEEAWRELPVIMLSARAGEESRIEGLDAGADDYLSKPFSARELIARVNTNLELSRIRREAKEAVQEREERLRAAVDASGTGTFRWHIVADEFRYDEALGRLLTLQPGRTLRTFMEFLARVHPHDRKSLEEGWLRCVREGENLDLEFRVQGPGEAIRWVYGRAKAFREGTGRPAYVTGAVVDVTERKRAEIALRQRTAQFETLLNAAPVAVYLVDSEFRIREVNPLARPVFGNIPNIIGRDLNEVMHILWPKPYADELVDRFRHTLETGEPYHAPELIEERKDLGTVEYYEWRISRIPLPDGGYGVVCYFRDISAQVQARQAIARSEERLRELNAGLEERVAAEVSRRVRAEDALRQAQKMEAVGQLTGGVAHDFNNLLTVIIGGLDTIRRSKPDDEARRKRALDMAFQGAQRAASLTGRLLAFSRRQPLAPKPCDVNVLVRDMTELLHRTLGEQVELEGILAPRLWRVEIDQNQLENAILNLAVNARDAMPEGGKLTIETNNTALDETYVATDAEVIAGQYVVIGVSDTGQGMSKETLSRVFEPFFTTKEVGRGTGLGLSQVYGFAKQSGGHITIYSEESHGTTVKLYFPRYIGEGEQLQRDTKDDAPTSSEGEVVLVVEDNEEVRAYSVMIFGELGYRVLEAAEAETALAILKSEQRIDLLFTDVVLPGKSGRVIAEEALAVRPSLKVLFTTGYSRNAIVHHGRLDPGVQLISKPFTFEQLATRVRDLLDR